MKKRLSKVGRIFLAGLVLGGVGAASARALAAYRVHAATSHCAKQPGAAPKYYCAFDTGSDFPAASLQQLEIDFNYIVSNQSDTIRASTTRESWNQVITTGGPATSFIVTTLDTVMRSKDMYPSVTTAQGGSQGDFRYIALWASTATIVPKGVYITNTAGN